MLPIFQKTIYQIPKKKTNLFEMENQYKYSLQKGSSKGICPECGQKRFTRYVDSITGDCLSEQFGRCDREINCGYHNKPVFEEDQAFKSNRTFTPKPAPQPLTPIPFEVLADTLTDYEQNIFIQNLLQRVAFPFEPCDIETVIAQYYLGTVANYSGAISLPYIDINNVVRAIQVKQFDETNHTTKTNFLHSILKYQYSQRGNRLPNWLPAYELNELKVSCLFGEHLLNKYPLNPIALVEAPKSAIYGTLYFGLQNVPERFLWIAAYNLSSLNVAKCKALQGREVVLFPDLSKDGKAFELWNSKLKELNTIKGARFTISDLLELKASEAERANGCDIADYLICKDWRLFRESVKSETVRARTREIEPPSAKSVKSEDKTKHIFCVPQQSKGEIYRLPAQTTWTNEIQELETYFAAVTLPAEPVKLNSYTLITNVPLFVENHLLRVKQYNGRNTFLPYLNRLQTLKQILAK